MSNVSIQPSSALNNTRWPGYFDLLTWTHVPDLLITFWLPQLSGSELKISLYVVRHTYGYHRETAAISFERFLNGTFRKDGVRLDWGAGVKRTQLKEGLPALVEAGILVRERRQDQRGGDTASSYALNLRGEETEQGPAPTNYRVPAPYAFTPVPNQVFDVLLPQLKERQLKTLLYITHHTSGLKRRHADISKARMLRGTITPDHRIQDRGVGITERSLDAALKDLVELGVIFREERRNPGGGPLPTRYGLNVRPEAEQAPIASDPLLPANSELPPSANSDGGVPVDSEPHERHELKTHERHVQQHLEINPTHETNVVVALTVLGITKRIAYDLARRCSAELIRAQIDMLPYRDANDPAAVLVKAIREEWAPPAGYKTLEQREVEAREVERIEAEREAWRQAQMAPRQPAEAGQVETPRQAVEFRPFQALTLDSRRVWATVVLDLKGQDGADAYLGGTQLLARDGDELVVLTASSYAAEWLQRRVAHRAKQVLSALGGEQVGVRFVAEADWHGWR